MKTTPFSSVWKPYEPLLEAIVALFHPLVEVAVHDLAKGVIAALYHPISKRKVGDPSPLKELKVEIETFPDYFPPYYKSNWDKRPLKCTSITLRNSQGTPIGLICINFDVSVFQEGHKFLESFLKIQKGGENPTELSGASFQEQITTLVDQYLEERQLTKERLSRLHKKELVQHLFRKGVFHFKNAIPFVAHLLHTSRASIYNYTKEL